MKTLEEHNNERLQHHDRIMKEMQSHANGIACPKCGEELWDSNPLFTLTSSPPQKGVHCPSCGYMGCRIA